MNGKTSIVSSAGCSQNFSEISLLQFPAAHGTSSTHRCSIISAWILINHTGICKSTSQLSFALLFRSIGALSMK
jgi:hypothetical protein